MIRLRDTRHQNTASFLGSAIGIAEYYGFSPLEDIVTRYPRAALPPSGKNDPAISFARREERTLYPAARKFLALSRKPNEAIFGWRITPSGSGVPSTSLELHIVGAPSSMAEAILLVVGNAIAEEAGLTERTLAVNNIGSAQSSGRYVRDVAAYLRKHIDSISPSLRPRAAEDPLGTLVQLIERQHPAISRAPQAMEYLTEEERRRFWELLEYLETLGLSYELNGQILGSRECWAHGLFEMSSADRETGTRVPFAFGGRYDPLASRLMRAPASGAMISITCEVRGKTRAKRQAAGIPSMFFAHLGYEARRQALGVLESLRRASIPAYHGLLSEQIGEQMIRAKELATPYILIMGHKEALENTILVREVASNWQEAVPLSDLPQYLKRKRLGVAQREVRA